MNPTRHRQESNVQSPKTKHCRMQAHGSQNFQRLNPGCLLLNPSCLLLNPEPPSPNQHHTPQVAEPLKSLDPRSTRRCAQASAALVGTRQNQQQSGRITQQTEAHSRAPDPQSTWTESFRTCSAIPTLTNMSALITTSSRDS